MATIHRRGAASATFLVAMSTGILTTHNLAPNWSRSVGLDFWNIAEVEHAALSAKEERAELIAKEEFFTKRRELANQLAAKLIDRTSTLAATTDQLRELFREDDAIVSVLKSIYPDVQDERLLFARHAMLRVEQLLHAEPIRRAEVLARLKADYRELEASEVVANQPRVTPPGESQ